MKQGQLKEQEPSKEEDKMVELRGRFEQTKKKATFRKVRLLYSNCCGCGCYDVTIERTVPADSDLQDGDRVDGYMDGDIMIEDEDE